MKIRQCIETWGPLSAGILAGVVHHVSALGSPANGDVFNSVTNICGITVGFLGTAQGLLLSVERNRLVIALKEMKVFGLLIDHFSAAIKWCIFCAVYSLVASLGVNEHKNGFIGNHDFLMSLWVLVAFTALGKAAVAIHFFSWIATETASRE